MAKEVWTDERCLNWRNALEGMTTMKNEDEKLLHNVYREKSLVVNSVRT